MGICSTTFLVFNKEENAQTCEEVHPVMGYASSLSQAGGTHSWWVLLVVREEKHTPVKILCFGLN